MNAPHPDGHWTLGPALLRSAWAVPYEVPTNEPATRRRLNVFSVDPSVSRTRGAVSVVSVPYERQCGPGPVSALFRIDLDDECSGCRYEPANLDDLTQLRSEVGGLQADASDPGFHAQMAYAVALLTYESFRKALGRHLSWGFHGDDPAERVPLRVRLFAGRDLNAWYSPHGKAIGFGYKLRGEAPANGSEDLTVFTSLSSDVIAHEVSHALLDGLKPYFAEPTNPDVEALHEALADLVALFQRFTYTELVSEQLARQRGQLTGRTLLRVIAPQLGKALARGRGLRTFESLIALAERDDEDDPLSRPIATMHDLPTDGSGSSHARGRVLAEAIFDAFETIVMRKTKPIVLLATEGRGVLPEGNVPQPLLEFIVHATRRTAEQFLAICVRAIDFCPPVHVEFGDFLRAMITADHELVKHDPHGYREAITMACLRRGIVPRYVNTPSEASLRWHEPDDAIPPIEGLALSALAFRGDPSIVPNGAEVTRQANVFGHALVTMPALRRAIGLHPPGGGVRAPEIVSIHPARRVGPDDQVAFDLVVQVVQSTTITVGGRKVPWRGGATIVLDPLGGVRYVVRKRVDQERRIERARKWLGVTERRERLMAIATQGRRDFRWCCFGEG